MLHGAGVADFSNVHPRALPRPALVILAVEEVVTETILERMIQWTIVATG